MYICTAKTLLLVCICSSTINYITKFSQKSLLCLGKLNVLNPHYLHSPQRHLHTYMLWVISDVIYKHDIRKYDIYKK